MKGLIFTTVFMQEYDLLLPVLHCIKAQFYSCFYFKKDRVEKCEFFLTFFPAVAGKVEVKDIA